MLTQELVRSLVDYDPETGVVTWKERGNGHFDKMFAGKRAGRLWTNPHSGYRRRDIKILGKLRREHHIIWIYMKGLPLPDQVDHINRDGTDNRWCNLRKSCPEDNMRNKSKYKNNTSGVTGVYLEKSGLWRAECRHNRKLHYLGMFENIDEAAMEVLEFKKETLGEVRAS